MLPVGPLMIEHRLIERMVALAAKESARIERERKIDPVFLDRMIDFMQVYADLCHHGKEEDLLYKALAQKKLSEEHGRLLAEILDEHRRTRRAVLELAEANASYRSGDQSVLSAISRLLLFLADLYRTHIDKEDRRFFLPSMEYFSAAEKDALLAQEREYDRDLVHRLYKDRVRKEEERFS